MLTHTEENYLKAIYSLQLQQLSSNVSTNSIAEKMSTRAPSVTDMVKKLSVKNLIHYVKYQGVSLTEKGRSEAVKIVRRHRLWECFLVEKLNFSWDKVHELAEQLEHVKSEELTDSLDEFLGFPTSDPHGDPIPDKQGVIKSRVGKSLNYFSLGKQGVLKGVQNSSKDFLKYLDGKKIALGDTIKIISKEPFDNSLVIQANQNEFTITEEVAKNLLVKEL